MRRRNFIQKAALSGSLLSLGGVSFLSAKEVENTNLAHSFQLKYAPHFGMFESAAGKDLVAQLEFMHAQGFTAFEDNDMRLRPIEEQETIAKTMKRLDMQMGVFVAHTISWNKPDLVTGDAVVEEKFLDEIKASVEVAKKVNAKWMTVLLGPRDLRMEVGYQNANVIK